MWFSYQCQMPLLDPGRCNMTLLNSCRKCSQTPWDTIWQATRCHHKSMTQISRQPRASEDKAPPRPWSACNTTDWLEWVSPGQRTHPSGVSGTWECRWGLKACAKQSWRFRLHLWRQSRSQPTQTSGRQINDSLQRQTESLRLWCIPLRPHKRSKSSSFHC